MYIYMGTQNFLGTIVNIYIHICTISNYDKEYNDLIPLRSEHCYS